MRNFEEAEYKEWFSEMSATYDECVSKERAEEIDEAFGSGVLCWGWVRCVFLWKMVFRFLTSFRANSLVISERQFAFWVMPVA